MKNFRNIVILLLAVLVVGCKKSENIIDQEEVIEDLMDLAPLPLDQDYIVAYTPPVHILEIEYSSFPLPEKYRGILSSGDSLRDSIAIPNSGGQITTASYHNALDIPVPDKTPVYACKAGYVKNVYPSYYNGSKWKGHPTYGGYIEIIHYDHTKSIYAHLSFTEVREGTYVERGQQIGWSGGVRGRRGSGTSTGPHLHWAVMLDLESVLE